MVYDLYDKLAGTYESFMSESFYYKFQRELELAMFEKYVDRNPVHPSRALDLGCGPGTYSARLLRRGFSVVAVDTSESMISLARQATRAGSRARDAKHRDAIGTQFVRRSVAYIASVPGKFDVAVAYGSVINHLEHEEEWVRCLEGLARKLRNGGVFLVGIDNGLATDSVGWLLETVLSGDSLSAEARDAWWRIRNTVNRRHYNNEWWLSVNDDLLTLHQSYIPLRRLRDLLERAGLELCEIRGTNALAALFPSVVRSSIYGHTETSLVEKRLIGLAHSIDRRLGGLLCSASPYVVLAARRVGGTNARVL